MRARFWHDKLRSLVARHLINDTGRKKLEYTEALQLLIEEEGLPEGHNWYNLAWVADQFSKLRWDDIAVMRLDAAGRCVVTTRRPTVALTVYGLDEQADADFTSWEINWWVDGSRGGVVGFHQKTTDAQNKKRYLRDLLDRGRITEKFYREEMCLGLG